MIFKTFGWSFGFTLVALFLAFLYGSWEAVFIAGILIFVEIFVSFDNAVVNSRILATMSEFWIKMFLSVGIIIAVFGVRLVLPILLVSATTGLNPLEVINLALENGDPKVPGTYGYHVVEAHPQLASVAGIFLLMLFLSWLFSEKEHAWIKVIEENLAKIGAKTSISLGRIGDFNIIPTILALVVLFTYANINKEHYSDVMVSGLIGLGVFLAIEILMGLFNDEDGNETAATQIGKKTGKAGFMGFLYLEAIDSSFSLDSLGAALAITPSIVIIMLGLGVGALYVRSMTVYLVHSGSLNNYRYLESGAMWAIGALSFILFFSINHHVPEMVTGGIGITVIGAAWIHSLLKNKSDVKHGIEVEKITAGATEEPVAVGVSINNTADADDTTDESVDTPTDK